MENVLLLPIDTVANISVQLWDILGVPALLGILITWMTQYVKLNPNIPYVEKGKPWLTRGFVVLVGTLCQLGFYVYAGKEITWEVVQQIALTYLSSSAAYTHLFRTK